MKIVFFGSSKYSTISANEVHKKYPISLVVTFPDRHSPSQILVSRVKIFAIEKNIPFITADKLTADIVAEIAKIHPDFLLVADYGLLLPKNVLGLPTKASLNIHHSLLPKYRGPSPAPSAILHGEKVSGVTVMTMADKLDTGDILAQSAYTLSSDETTDSLLTKLNQLGGTLATKVLGDFDRYFATRKQQDESQATYTKQITKQDGYIEISNLKSQISNLKLDQMIRAYYPWPGVWTKFRIKNQEVRIKLLPERKIQIEGKKPVSYTDFVNGYSEGQEILNKLHLNL